MKNKCLICNKKNSRAAVTVREWITTGITEAKFGKNLDIHAHCLSNTLSFEKKDRCIFGSIALYDSSKKKK